MCNLELEIGRRLRGRALGVHPCESNNAVACVREQKSSTAKGTLRFGKMRCCTQRLSDRVTVNPNRVSSAEGGAKAHRKLALDGYSRGPVEGLIFLLLRRFRLLLAFDFFARAIIHLLAAVRSLGAALHDQKQI